MKKIFFILILLTLSTGAFMFLSKKSQETTLPSPQPTHNLTIVSTLFPQYDFAKNIGKEKVKVTLLLPPGIEPHSYEPTPNDIATIQSADIFLYTGDTMEPWAKDLIESIPTSVKVVDVSTGTSLIQKVDSHGHSEETEGLDPHIWLDFDNAKIMAQNITTALEEKDPSQKDYYRSNLTTYQKSLTELDSKYKTSLLSCEENTIIYGGHYAFGYLANRYNLEYITAQGFSPDSEPSAKDMISLTDQIKKGDIRYIFYETLTSPKIAETLSRETQTNLLELNPAHNLSREAYNKNTSFITIMEQNLNNLEIGLQCSL